MTPWGCMLGLLSVQQQFVAAAPTPGRGPREQHPVTAKQIQEMRRKTNEATIRLPPGPTPPAKISERMIPKSVQSMAAPILNNSKKEVWESMEGLQRKKK